MKYFHLIDQWSKGFNLSLEVIESLDETLFKNKFSRSYVSKQRLKQNVTLLDRIAYWVGGVWRNPLRRALFWVVSDTLNTINIEKVCETNPAPGSKVERILQLGQAGAAAGSYCHAEKVFDGFIWVLRQFYYWLVYKGNKVFHFYYRIESNVVEHNCVQCWAS